MQKFIEHMTGYKATDKDMVCQPDGAPPFKYELGKWYEHEGEIKLCGAGFHFCVHPSGPWSFYSAPGTRIFKVEAEQVLDSLVEPGADFKLVAKRIRLVEEVMIGGHRNTGDCNTGDCNTGDWNTGHRNTGDWNTGHRNTGDCNTGNWNTGHRNTGDCNTGDCNTGDCNTGNCNTGDCNTGNWNTGNCNTGNWNTANFSSGMFCANEPKVVSFDVQTKLTREQYFDKYPEVYELGRLFDDPDPIAFARFKNIPGITKAKLAALHKAHLEARKKA